MAYESFTNGAVLPASKLNSAFGTSGWTTFTPTVSTGLTVGNGVWSAAYMQIGKTVHLRIRFTLGTTSAVTAPLALNLPKSGVNYGYGAGFFVTGGTNYPAIIVTGAVTLSIYAQNAAGTYLTRASTSATVPGTWASTDSFTLSVTYEAA